MLVLRAGVLPWLLRRALAGADAAQRETRPLVNVAASLLAAAAADPAGARGVGAAGGLAPTRRPQAVPIGIAVVLIGFFVLVTRRRALSQLVGFLLMDNGITAVGFLTTGGVSGWSSSSGWRWTCCWWCWCCRS